MPLRARQLGAGAAGAEAARLGGRALAVRAARRRRVERLCAAARPRRSWSTSTGSARRCFCHGSPRSDEECVTAATPAERVGSSRRACEEACVVTAHTHMQYDRRVGETRLLNPGSVGLPYEPEPGYAYWALLGPDVELRRTPYDLEAAIERMRAAGMPKFEQIEELMRTPPPQAEVIEHAERVVFSGLDSDEGDRRGDAGGREGNAARPLRGRGLPGLPARRVLLGRAARPRPRRREGARRHISLVTSPTETRRRRPRDAAARHRVQAHARRLEVGDEVEVEEPKGSFLLPEDTSAEYVFVAGGIGITVFRSMLRYIADDSCRTGSRSSTRTATANRRRSSTSSRSWSSASRACRWC